MENQNNLGIKTLQIIWAFLFLGTAPLIFLSYQASQAGAAEGDFAQMKLIFTVVAVVEFVLAWLLPKIICGQSIQASFAGWVIQFALFESICLFGFILVFVMTKKFNDIFPFMALSYLGFILRFPTEDKIEKMCSKI
jgi:hypothetical protein